MNQRSDLQKLKQAKKMTSRVRIDDSWKIGIVRIYDDDRGNGFITELGAGPTFKLDFFVNESAIKQYMPTRVHKRRLLTGEYVHFLVDVRHTPIGTQRQRVAKVRGLFGGPLMFEQGEVVFNSYTRINQTMYPQASPAADNYQNTGSMSTDVMDSVVTAPEAGGEV